ncbi:MAG: amidohydrolase [Actinomycetota bacterium]|nr:amidohydrolase [Actinomycetota bacterium]
MSWRRHLHRHPELSFHEHQTARYIEERLASFGGLELSRPTPTSVVGRLVTGRGGPVLALRADIDALPILEESALPFASERDGVMHACGHDGHTAGLLAVARLLLGLRGQLRGEVRFLFQHAEEQLPGGARELIAAGVLDGVDFVVGCHLVTSLELGAVAVPVGPFMAAPDTFSIVVEGRGGHAAAPHDTVDPVAIAAQLVTNLQHVVARETDAGERVVVSVTRIAGGSADNVVPESVELGGTVRTFSTELRDRTRAAMERVGAGVTRAHAAGYRFEYAEGYLPVDNEPALARRVTGAVRRTLGEDAVVTDSPPVMYGDDFSAYQREAPGVYFHTGARSEETGAVFPHHHPRFTFDERAMENAVAAFVETAFELLA